MKTTFIYALSCPETGECRYVGKADDPHDRLFGRGGHIKTSHKLSRHCANWIKSLTARGLTPVLETLAKVPDSHWEFWERSYIRLYRCLGFDLTNLTAGGDGVRGYKHTPETREKLRSASLGKKPSPETREKLRSSSLGKKKSPETRANMSAAQKGKNTRRSTAQKIGLRALEKSSRPNIAKRWDEVTSEKSINAILLDLRVSDPKTVNGSLDSAESIWEGFQS